MSIKLGNTDVNKMYLGNTDVNKMYLGDNVIFENILNPRPSLLNSYNQESNTLDVTVTATPTSGNYLIAQLALGNYSSDPVAPVGWTKIHETVNGFGAHAFFVKKSDGTETSIVFSKTGGSGQIFMASIHEFKNVSNVAFYEDLQVSGRAQGTSIGIPSLTSNNSFSLAVSFVTALNINNVDDSITTPPSDYHISSQYSSSLGQGAWNIALTQECEDVTLVSDNITFSESVIHSTLNMVLNPITVNNLYPYSNAVGDDADSYDDWNWTSSISVVSVASTDPVLGDNYAIRLEARNDGLTSSSTSHVVTGLTQDQEYKAIIRCRAMVTGGNTSNVFFNWNNVTNTTYNGTIIGTEWEEVEILFTPTNSTSFTLKAYPFFNSSGSLAGDFLEISSIVIEKNVFPE